MDVLQDIEIIFGLPTAKTVRDASVDLATVATLAVDGCPRIYGVTFFPSADAIAAWNSLQPRLPDRCCVCYKQAVEQVPPMQPGLWRRIKARLGFFPEVRLPVCADHLVANGARFVLQIDGLKTNYVMVGCFGESREFIESWPRTPSARLFHHG